MSKTKYTDIQIVSRTMQLLSRPKVWIKGSNRKTIDGRACYCLNGAINHVTPGSNQRERVKSVLRGLIYQKTNGAYSGIESWNDDYKTRLRNVLALLNRAKKQLKQAPA